MASTYSTNLAIELIGTGDQAGTWGVTTNTNLGTLIEQAISGYVTQAVATGTDTTISIPNGATGVARNMYIELTGTGGTNTNLIVPANKKLYFIFNNTASGQVTVKVSGQTGVSVPNKAKIILVSNGTDIVDATNYVTSATIGNITATSGTITTLTSTSATITTFTSSSGTITNLIATTASVAKLTATADSEFTSTGALLISKGTAGQQPGTPVTGMLRYNTTSNEFEGYSGSSPSWKSVGGSAISNDTSTATDLYPSFLAATTGTAQNIYTSNARLLYKPSTGEFKALAPVATNGIIVNSSSMSVSYTIAAGSNGFTVGPFTVNSGVTLTVTSGQRHIVI